MKKIISITTLFFLITIKSGAQNIGINADGTKPDASAMLDVKSTVKGILIPRMSTIERNAIVAPVQGLLVYQTDAPQGFYFYDGASWNMLITQGAGMYNFGFTGTIALGFNQNVSTKVNFNTQNYLNNVTFSNGAFTAPSSGIYSFSVNMLMYGNSATSMSMGFFVNNSNRSVGTFNIIGGIFQSKGYSDNLLLNTGDQVTVQINPSSYISGYAMSFTGFRIN